MSREWFKQKERSSVFWLIIIRWIAIKFGRPITSLVLYPITFYFLVFSVTARKASKEYLTRVLGRPCKLRHQFQHIHSFSTTILDRFYLLNGQDHLLDIRIHDEDVLLSRAALGKGCILLGSHLGSFEVLRALALKHHYVSLKILMYDNHNENIVSFLNALNPDIAKSIISLGSVDALLRVKESLDNGDVIGMLADRVAESDKQIECDFLGEVAAFPTGPMNLAVMLDVPVILFYGLYKGGRRYDIHFEVLTDTPSVKRSERLAQINKLTLRYVERLEHHVRQSPYNWFNFYDYWRTS